MKFLTLMMAAVAVPTITNAVISNVVDDSPAGGSSSPTMPQGDPNRYIVMYRNNQGFRHAFVAGQVHVDLPDFNAVAVTIPPEALEGLQNNPDVESIERDVLRFPAGRSSIRGIFSKSKTNHDSTTTTSTTTDPTRSLTGGQQTPYGIRLVQADQVPMGPFVPKICIIDSGYYLGHEDLPVEPQVTGDSDIGGTGEWFLDEDSHGTHVAGTIAAVDNDRGVVGVCPGCNLHIVRVLGRDGSTGAYSSDIAGAALKCRDAGANIINMSLGGIGSGESFEHKVFDTLLNVDNILLVAAAGNDGSTQFSYPASYDCFMSVCALDDHKHVAGFSQKNSQVDISAPGVAVLSTVSGYDASVIVAGGSTYEATNMRLSEAKVLQAGLFDCGQALAVCTGANGLICLIQRGEITFADKVTNCVNGGGIGAIIYNNEAGIFNGTLGDGWSIGPTAVGVSDSTGAALLALAPGTVVTLSVTPAYNLYDAYNGTSMAAPYVSGVAGLVWSHFDATMSAQEIRNALTSTALDLGPVGRDDECGFGLVRACNAAQALGVPGLTCFDTSACVEDAECDDGNFCNGLETCDLDTGFCRPSSTGNPCGLNACDEETNACVVAADQCSALGASCQFPTDCCSGRCTVIHNSLYCS